MNIKEQQMNEQIRDKELRIIDEDGSQLGLMSSKDALELAVQKNLDLVKISPNANPPVCKIMDLGKFKYEMAKKEKESKKKQKTVTIKEVRLRPSIEEHDLSTKAKMAYKFLEGGDKVKVSVRFRGRELGHKEIGVEVIKSFVELVKDVGTPDRLPRLEGNTMIVMLDPKKTQ